MKEFSIAGRKIGKNHPPFLVAEISANHNHSWEKAVALVKAAKMGGAHAIKLQTYTADTLTMDGPGEEFLIQEKDSLWAGKRLYELYKEAYTPWEWHEPLFDICRAEGLLFFSTPFDESAVEFLASLHVPCFKIASHEITHLPLIHKAASYQKPLILSTGMASLGEIEVAIKTATEAGCPSIMLLKCTSEYPASPKNCHLRTLPHLKNLFDLPVGLSDHTLGIGAALASIAFGASLIEKHLTLCRADGGSDSGFSMEPDEFRLLSFEAYHAWESLGEVRYGPLPEEKVSYSHRRSIYFTKDLQAGACITPDCLKIIRPNAGLAPSEYQTILGMRVVRDVKQGTPVRWEVLKPT